MELNQPLPRKPLTIKIVPPPTPLATIAAEVVEKHGLTLAHLRLHRRLGPLVAARNEFYYRAAIETRLTYSEIARWLGYNHTSICYGVARHCLQYDLQFPLRYDLPYKRLVQMTKAKGTVRFPRRYRNSRSDTRAKVKLALEQFNNEPQRN